MSGPSNSLNCVSGGLVAFDGDHTFFGRTLQSDVGISITNGNGETANPKIKNTGVIGLIGQGGGTNPVLPNASGYITFQGSIVAASGNPVVFVGNFPANNQIQVQIQAAIAQPTNLFANAGLASFNNAQFSVTTNGFVSLTSLETVTIPGAAASYTTLDTDYFIGIDGANVPIVNLIANPTTGQTYRIKDIAGTAAANNITITPIAKNIDGLASYVINNNYGSIDVVYNSTEWSIV